MQNSHRYNPVLKAISIFALLMLSLSLLFTYSPAREEENSAVPVRTFKVSRKNIRDRVFFTGTIKPWKRANIIPAIGGKLDRISVEQGDWVEKGDVMASLDMVPVRIQLNQAEAAVAVAEVNLEDARTNYGRLLTLKKKGTISTREYEKARLAFESARAGLRQAEANEEMARYNADEAAIKAPFAGHVTARYAEEGDILNPMPGTPGVATLMDISSVRIEGTVPAPEIKHTRKGLEALITVDTYPDTTFTGSVYSVSPAAGIQTRSFPLEVKVRNPHLQLKPGFFARVEIIARERHDVPAVPVDALVEKEDKQYIFVIENNRAKRIEVKTGLREGLFVEIISGVTEGETVILAGNTVVADGNRVRVERGKGK